VFPKRSHVKNSLRGVEARPPLINGTARVTRGRGRVGARTHCPGSGHHQASGQDAIAVRTLLTKDPRILRAFAWHVAKQAPFTAASFSHVSLRRCTRPVLAPPSSSRCGGSGAARGGAANRTAGGPSGSSPPARRPRSCGGGPRPQDLTTERPRASNPFLKRGPSNLVRLESCRDSLRQTIDETGIEL